MNRRFLLAPVVAVTIGALTGCSTPDTSDDSLSSTTAPTPVTSTQTATSSATQPSTSSSQTPTPDNSNSGNREAEQLPAENQPAAEPQNDEPYVVTCAEGVPGPAEWSDGVTRFSQECYDEAVAHRGSYRCPQTDAYVNDPSECAPWQREDFAPATVPFANGGTCPAAECGYGTAPDGTPYPSSGEIQMWWANCTAENSDEYCRSIDPYLN